MDKLGVIHANKTSMCFMFFLSCVCLVRVCLYVPCGQLLGKG